VLASSHVDRVTANSVYGKRLPFSGSQERANSFDHAIRLRPKGNSNKDGGFRDPKTVPQSQRAVGRLIRAAGASSYLGSVDVDAEQKRDGPKKNAVVRIELILIISNPLPSICFRSPTRYAGAIPNWRNTPHSNTPSLRVAGFEGEDENEAPCEAALSSEGRRYRKQPKIDALRQYKEEILEAHRWAASAAVRSGW
jgi:hypothetical protein